MVANTTHVLSCDYLELILDEVLQFSPPAVAPMDFWIWTLWTGWWTFAKSVS